MEGKPPLVSVVIPCYNYGQYVEEAIDSVLQSTWTDLEIIVVNDGSTDPHTKAVLHQLRKPKTTIIHQTNKGLPAARNAGIRMARGTYILPLDADDKIHPRYVEQAVKILKTHPRIGFVTCWVKRFGDSHGIWRCKPYNFYRQLFANNVAVASLFRKTAWKQAGGYNENMKRGYEDWDFWISLGKKGWHGYTIPQPLFFYRKHGPSMITESVKIHHQLVRQIRANHPELYTPRMLRKLRKIWIQPGYAKQRSITRRKRARARRRIGIVRAVRRKGHGKRRA